MFGHTVDFILFDFISVALYATEIKSIQLHDSIKMTLYSLHLYITYIKTKMRKVVYKYV